MATLISEHERELLSRAILRTLDSWPKLHQQIFSEAHYHGKSPEAISGSLGVSPDSVRQILRDCEAQLRRALKSFWEDESVALHLTPKYAVNQ